MWLRKFSIKQRLNMLVGLMLFGLAVLSISVIFEYRSKLIDLKKEETTFLVESAHSIIERFETLVAKGKLDKELAQQQAKDLIKSMRYDNDNYFWIQDQNTQMIMYPLSPELDGTNVSNILDVNGLPFYQQIGQQSRVESQGYINYLVKLSSSNDTAKKLAFYKVSKDWSWVIVSGVYLNSVDDAFSSLIRQIIVEIIVIVGIAAFLGFVISRSIEKPIQDASARMKDISCGDGDLTQSLDESGSDEISQLARSFNTFAGSLRELLTNVSQSSIEVKTNAESIMSASEEAVLRTQTQSDSASSVAAAMEEITTNTMEVSRNAQNVESATHDAQNNVLEGKNKVESTLSEIQQLASNIEGIHSVITTLANDSQNIGAVLDVIRGIAEQTNLLALNAAIEAARAGEQGRGFAVVADEVRTLASRTGQSTEEIQVMIQRLQDSASEAVKAVKSSQESFDKTQHEATQAGDSLHSVDEIMKHLLGVVQQISSATEQQADAANEINTRINELSSISSDSHQTNKELTQSCDSLHQNSENMSGLIGRFKLK